LDHSHRPGGNRSPLPIGIDQNGDPCCPLSGVEREERHLDQTNVSLPERSGEDRETVRSGLIAPDHPKTLSLLPLDSVITGRPGYE
jgi:hypothetical protein